MTFEIYFSREGMVFIKLFRKILGVFCITEVLVGVYITLTQLEEQLLIGVMVCALFGFFAYLLLRKSKNQDVHEDTHTNFQLDVPQETIKEMRAVKRSIHSDSLIRVIKESYEICKNTTSLEIFESRLEFATQKAYTLKEMEIAGLYNDTPTADSFLSLLVGKRSELLQDFLQRSYDFALKKAKKELKTEKGVQNRIQKFIEELDNSALDFDISKIKK